MHHDLVRRSSALFAALFCGSCGIGTVGIGALAGGDDSNGEPAVNADQIVATGVEKSPARISFLVTDPESDSTGARIEFFDPNAGTSGEFRPMLLRPDSSDPEVRVDLSALPTSPSGERTSVLWDFAASSQLGREELTTNTTIRVVVGSRPPVTKTIPRFGNDAAEVVRVGVPQGGEVAGNVDITLAVRDTSSHSLDVAVQYRTVSPSVGPWKTARPAGIPATQPSGEFGLQDLASNASEAGIEYTFVWDTAFDSEGTGLPPEADQLGGLEVDVELRVRAEDGFDAGEEFDPGTTFRIDNNATPIAILDGASIATNPDRRRAIPIPYSVVDPEEDDVFAVLQWRRLDDAGFPELPADPAEMARILEDDELRRQLQIATEAPLVSEGEVVPQIGMADALRLPELAEAGAYLPPDAVAGLELSILRSAQAPSRVVDTWSQPPPNRPQAVLPVDGSPTALILDGTSGGGWELVEMHLATGAVSRTLASRNSQPIAMTYERARRDSVLVLATSGALWRVFRVEFESTGAGAVTKLVQAPAAGTARDIASLGENAALVTVDDELVWLDLSQSPAGEALPLLDGLQAPQGIAVDPLRSDRVFVAERDHLGSLETGRVLVIELSTELRSVVFVKEFDGTEQGFPRPTALAFDETGSRLLVLTDEVVGDGTVELRGLQIGGAPEGEYFELTNTLSAESRSLAAGPDGQLLVAVPALQDIAVGGGIEQIRTIDAYSPVDQVARVSADFAPPLDSDPPGPASSRRWRITRATQGRNFKAVAGATNVLVWDTADVPEGGDLFLKLTPFDSEVGLDSTLSTPRSVIAPLVGAETSHGDPSEMDFPVDVALGDLDGDGLLDMAAANAESRTVTIYLQQSTGKFGDTPDQQIGLSGSLSDLREVLIADVDDDGRADLVVSHEALAVFFQPRSGIFADVPDLDLSGATFASVAHLNADDLPDIVARDDSLGSKLLLHFQGPPRSFTFQELDDGGADLTGVTTGDLNGDGATDIATSSGTDGTLAIYYQEAGEYADPPEKIGGGPEMPSAEAVQAADVDGDGLLDLAAASASTGTAFVFLQDAADGLPATPAITVGGLPTTLGARAVDAADFNKDGLADLVLGTAVDDEFSTGGLFVFFQGAQGFKAEPDLNLVRNDVHGIPRGFELGDCNADGRLDIALAGSRAEVSGGGGIDRLTVFLQAPPGAYPELPNQDIKAAAPEFVELVDLSGDGWPDLVGQTETGRAGIYPQISPGRFLSSPVVVFCDPTGLTRPVNVAVADVSGDGRLDVLTANRLQGPQNGGNLGIFFQKSSGQFEKDPDVVLTGGDFELRGPVDITVVDLDSDGDLDLLSANNSSRNVTAFENTGAGNFAGPSFELVNADNPQPINVVLAADVDGDGWLDVVGADDVILIWYGTPTGFEPTPETIPGIGFVFEGGMRIEDMDGDGRKDIVAVNEDSKSVVLFFQREPRVFAPGPTVIVDPVGSVVTNIHVVDADGDGWADVFTAGQLGDGIEGAVTLYCQSGAGVFGSVPDFALEGRFVYDMAVADLNRDGEPDFVLSTDLGSEEFYEVFLSGQ